MAIKIEISRPLIEAAIEAKLASLKRSVNTATNPLIAEIYQKEIAEYTTAKNTMVETTK